MDLIFSAPLGSEGNGELVNPIRKVSDFQENFQNDAASYRKAQKNPTVMGFEPEDRPVILQFCRAAAAVQPRIAELQARHRPLTPTPYPEIADLTPIPTFKTREQELRNQKGPERLQFLAIDFLPNYCIVTRIECESDDQNRLSVSYHPLRN